MLRSAQDCLSLGDSVLAAVGAGEAEVTVTEEDHSLTRFAGNAIHQNVATTELVLRLRLIREGRVGVAELRSEAPDAPQRLVHNAEDTRRLAPVAQSPAPFPQPDGGDDSIAGYSTATAEAGPELRADAVATVARAAARRGLQAFGAFSTGTRQIAMVSTTGVRRCARTTAASLTAVVRGEDGAGYADSHAIDVADVDAEAVAAEVVERTERNQGASAAEVGVYPVVLSPYAVAEMVENLSWMGFGALAKQEGRSFMRLGEQLMSPAVTIGDDAADRRGCPFPFDGEGVTTRKVTMIDSGVCRDFVYDTPTALVDGVVSTGHGLPQPNTFGPYASHLVVATGDADPDELIAGVKRGLFVTRFWYVREVHPLRTVITGMTREGTFLIEDGRLGRPVRDLRFTQSIIEALSTVEGISRQLRLEMSEDGSAVLAPWLRLGRFTFTS